MTSNGRSRLRRIDIVRLAVLGFRTRLGRSVLTALGIAIGIGSLVAVVGLSASSRAALVAEIDELGTNLLSVQPGQSFSGESIGLPPEAPDRIRRIPPVLAASSLDFVDGSVQRSTYDNTPNAIRIAAVEPELFDTLRATINHGRALTSVDGQLPVVVLGATAANRLQIHSLANAIAINVNGEPRHVVGILDPLPLAEALDTAVFIGLSESDNAETATSVDIIYVRAIPEAVLDVRNVLAATTNPTQPHNVAVQRPSDTLEARAQVDTGLRNLLLALGAVALVVGAIGIGNVMIISVLERQGEIGLRRSLGAKRRHIVAQFLSESAFLALCGGLAGAGIGTTTTIVLARYQGWNLAIPAEGILVAVAISLAVGIFAGAYPAIRAAMLDPAQAVRPGS